MSLCEAGHAVATFGSSSKKKQTTVIITHNIYIKTVISWLSLSLEIGIFSSFLTAHCKTFLYRPLYEFAASGGKLRPCLDQSGKLAGHSGK